MAALLFAGPWTEILRAVLTVLRLYG